jgi:FAD synthetase
MVPMPDWKATFYSLKQRYGEPKPEAFPTTTSESDMPTAAFIAIGDEILSGKFADQNSPYMIRRLREQGVDLKKIAVVPDEIAAIADEVQRCSLAFDHVFTSGGVGPTHDDITLEAVAEAFGEKLVVFDEVLELLQRRYGKNIPDPALQMARLPESAELHWEKGLKFPLVVVRNVVVFPGVPSFLQIKFEAGAHRWTGSPVHIARVYTRQSEVSIAEILAEAQSRWPDLSVGSYPRFEEEEFHVIATIEGRDPDQVEICATWLRSALGVPPSSTPSP